MRAVVMEDIGALALADVPEPVLEEPTDALVRVRKAAICGSDLHVLHGKIPGMPPGGVIGHEFTGVVEAVGDDVEGIAVGDRVVGSFLVPCGRCEPCGERAYNHCDDLKVLGYGMLFGDLAGAQAERVRVPSADLALMRIPDDLTDEQVVFAGDVLTTGLYVNRIGDVGPGKVVAVLGCGPVGIFAVQFAKALGAETVVAVDLVEERLELARRYGVETINASRSNPGVAMEDFSGGRGAHVVLDTAGGSPAVLIQGVEMVRAGGTVAVVGVYSDPTAELPLATMFVQGKTLRFGGTCPVPALWHEAVEAVRRGDVDPTGLISHRLPLERALEGYELFESRNATKVVLEVSD